MNGNILVLAPHTDDGEFGCGGTIARFSSEGRRVIYVAFSAAEQSVLPHLPGYILPTEFKQATAVLGIAPDDCIVLDFPVRRFPEHRQEILERMVQLNAQFSPSIVFLPSSNDTHQDHAVIAQEGFRAFKKTTLLGYEVPWNNLDFRTSSFVRLSTRELELKVKSLHCYRSQEHRDYAANDHIRSLLRVRGVQIGTAYAECFEVFRWIM
jgi:LmbE family N-acetylglucosaminyl deacetylase